MYVLLFEKHLRHNNRHDLLHGILTSFIRTWHRLLSISRVAPHMARNCGQDNSFTDTTPVDFPQHRWLGDRGLYNKRYTSYAAINNLLHIPSRAFWFGQT